MHSTHSKCDRAYFLRFHLFFNRTLILNQLRLSQFIEINDILMNTKLVESLVQMIESLPPDDYALFQEQLTIRSIQKTKGVCGGHARIRNTRIAVWTTISLQNQGADSQELLRNFPVLTPFDLMATQIYYQTHTVEIDNLITSPAEENDGDG